MENRSFLVDTSNLKDVNDVLADDSGSWVNNGQHRSHYELDEDGIYRRVGRRASFDTSVLSWLISVARYVFKSPSICF